MTIATDSDGRIAAAAPYIYKTLDGVFLFSEKVDTESEPGWYLFSGRKTAILNQSPQGMAWIRLDKVGVTLRRVPLHAIVAMDDCPNIEMLNAARGEISGLTLVGKMPKPRG